jgi:Arc/MetJ-type ribon-helix-helix transcriptional regulator
MQSINVSLPDELALLVQSRVIGGMYNDANEVICEAVRNFAKSEHLYDIYLSHIKS